MNSTISSGDKPYRLMSPETIKQSGSFKIAEKLKDYMLLVKFNLSFMVVFSAVISYLLAPKVTEYDWKSIILLFVGGMLVTGSANAINQAMEKQTDAMMKRTAGRPVASGRMSPAEATSFAVICGLAGTMLLWHFNFLTALLSVISLFFYAFIYTPLKKVSSVAVLVGAVPGAMPCLIGWAAGNDSLSAGGWILFALQFFWQFPHFWAIAWIAHKDYSAAGFKLLPSGEGQTKYSALQAVIYSLLLLPVGILPYFNGMSGSISLLIVLVANFFMIGQCVRLYREMTIQAARRVMFGSYIYLPVVLLALLIDKVAN
jgi:protoheme IX farnesyltransferase